jgi:hypothetical protein
VERAAPALRFALVAAATLLLFGCRSPTEITVALSTDVACASFAGIDLYAADPHAGDPFATDPEGELATQAGCPGDAGASSGITQLGTFVLAPSGASNDAVEVVVVGAAAPDNVNTLMPYPANDCVQLLGSSAGISGTQCIVARRILAFVPHTPITLPIELTSDCEGVDCPGGTCVDGLCRSAMIDNPAACGGHVCGPSYLGSYDADSGGVDSGLPGEAGPTRDATVDSVVPSDAPPDRSEMDGADGSRMDANGTDAADAAAEEDSGLNFDAGDAGACNAPGECSVAVQCGGNMICCPSIAVSHPCGICKSVACSE